MPTKKEEPKTAGRDVTGRIVKETDIDRWVGRLSLDRIEELAPIVAMMHQAAYDKDTNTLKSLAREHGGMLRKLARAAIAQINGDNTNEARTTINAALGCLYSFTEEYREHLRRFIDRAVGKPMLRPEMPERNLQFNREDRRAERLAIIEALVDDTSTNSQLLVDCLFACITASNEQLAEVKLLLAKAKEE